MTLIVALTVARLWPFLQGRLPAVGDHPVHLHKLWFLWERLLPRGRISGWSGFWGLGEPVGSLYPPGQDLWTAAVRALTLGQLSWERGYGLALAGFHALAAGALYGLGRRLWGRPAGLAAAVLWLCDPGGWEEGGWRYQVHFGVWGQGLGLALLWPAYGRALDLLEGGGRRALGLAALLAALAVIAHPMSLILLGLGGGALLVFYGRERGAASRVLAAGGLGLLASAGWLLPFLGRADYARNIGGDGVPLAELVAGLGRGELLTAVPPGVGLLAVLGAALALAARDRRALALLLVFAALFLLRAGPVATLLADQWPWPDLSTLQYRRFGVPARALLFLFAGAGVGAMCTWIRRAREAPGRGLLGIGLLAGLVAAGVELAAQARQDRASLVMMDETPMQPAYERWLDWSRRAWAEREADYRVALLLGPHDHRLMASTITNRTPLLKIGYTPAHLFALLPDRASNGLYQATAVRWLLSDHPLDHPQARPVEDWGSLLLYEYTDYRPERFHLEGAGFAELLGFEDERVAIRLRGTDASSRLVLHVAEFPRWEATRGGEALPIARAPLWEGGEPLGMSVPARDGVILFRYARRPLDYLASALGALGLALCLGLIRGRGAARADRRRSTELP